MPMGAKDPNKVSEIGAVKICAPVEAPRDEAKKPGKKRL